MAAIKTVNEQMIDAYLSHQLYVFQFASYLRNRAVAVFFEEQKRLRELVLTEVSIIQGLDFNSLDGRRRLKKFKTKVEKLKLKSWNKINEFISSDLEEFSVLEATRARDLILKLLPVQVDLNTPNVKKLKDVVRYRPFQGKVLQEWLNTTASADVVNVVNTANIGIVSGQNPKEIVNQIFGPKGGINPAMRSAVRNLEATLITVVNGIQNESKQVFYQENPQYIEKEIYLATLDSRTTLICAGNDNKVFEIGKGPIPPLHFRCRSLRVPYFEADSFVVRPFKAFEEKEALDEFTSINGLQSVSKASKLPFGYKTKFKRFSNSKKRELIGEVPGRLSYKEWFNQQSASFKQNSRVGRTLNLDEFKAKSAVNF